MTGPRRAWAPRVAIPFLAAALFPLPGCGGGQTNDFERARSGGPLKTPSDVRREAEGGKAEEPAPADTSKRAPK